jgi:ankyrin repeat protein
MDDGTTALQLHSFGHIEVVKMLLAEDADVQLADQDGSRPVQFALENGHLEVVKLLLKSHADVGH